MDTPSTTVGPGIGAFIAFFVLALVLWVLMRNMNGRMRRMAYREQQRVDELEAQEAKLVAEGRGPRPGKRRARRDAEAAAPPAATVADPETAADGRQAGSQAGTDDPTP